MIDEILDEFDFEKVHRVMLALNWTWHNTNGVPSISDLRRMARSLLQHVVSSREINTAASGGLTAFMHHGVLGLRFEVSNYEIEIEKGIGQ